MPVTLVLLLSLATTAAAEPAEPAETPNSLGQRIENFKLRDFRGAWHELDDYADKKTIVVVFLGTECPLVKLYAGRLSEIHENLQDKGGMVLGINANQQDSITKITHFARVNEIPFPILKDVNNEVADAFGAKRTPEAFVLDDDRVIRYRGRIDDQYGVGYSRPEVKGNYVTDAVEDVLAGKPVRQAETEAAGCFIGRKRKLEPTGDVTYAKQVSRILQKRCLECHREGQLAPFALTSYDDAVGWAETIAEVIDDQRMPPWHANPDHGAFANDAQMPEAEKDVIFEWIANGTPQGDPKDLPEPLEYAEGWRIPEPDLVVSMPREFTVLPEGEVDPKTGKPTGQVRYQYFQGEHVFEEDTWIQAAEAKPGNPSVVHHIIVFVKPPGKEGAKHGELMSDWLVATAPGALPLRLPDGMAKFVPKGSTLVFQMHYTPDGTTQTDRSSVGLILADPKTVRKEVITDKAFSPRFEIPPHADNHRVEATRKFRRDTLLLAMFPHMHLRGKSFRYIAEYPDDRPDEILLDVPRYDFNWQNSYILAEPKLLPAGTTLRCVAHYDNSEKNLANPDPTKSVRWGDQTWQEMMIGYFDAALADQDLTKAEKPKSRVQQFLERYGRMEAEEKEAAEYAGGALKDPDAFRQFAQRLQPLAPQLDRMCVTSLSDGKLTVEHAIHSERLDRDVAMRGYTATPIGFALARYANGTEPAMNADLSKAQGPDLRAMSRALGSSFHVPIEIDGKPGTVNFWSIEADAFPPEAKECLTKFVAAMRDGT